MIGKRKNNKASNKTYNRQPYHSKVHYLQKTNKMNPPSVTKQDNVNITIHGQPDVSAQKENGHRKKTKIKHEHIKQNNQKQHKVAAKAKIISRRAGELT